MRVRRAPRAPVADVRRRGGVHVPVDDEPEAQARERKIAEVVQVVQVVQPDEPVDEEGRGRRRRWRTGHRGGGASRTG
jgi:hypothetical protein